MLNRSSSGSDTALSGGGRHNTEDATYSLRLELNASSRCTIHSFRHRTRSFASCVGRSQGVCLAYVGKPVWMQTFIEVCWCLTATFFSSIFLVMVMVDRAALLYSSTASLQSDLRTNTPTASLGASPDGNPLGKPCAGVSQPLARGVEVKPTEIKKLHAWNPLQDRCITFMVISSDQQGTCVRFPIGILRWYGYDCLEATYVQTSRQRPAGVSL